MQFIENFFAKYSQEQINKWFKQICLAEAFSWLFLFSAMIWIRYDRDGLLPTIYIIIIGNIHGLFFTLYLLLLMSARKIYKWDEEDTVFALLSAFFPFATIWVDKKLARFDRVE
jgi:integral membrane protein